MEDRLGSLWWYEAILFQKIFPKKVSLACISKFCVVSELLIFYEKIAIFGRGAKKIFFSKKIYISENTQNFEMHERHFFWKKLLEQYCLLPSFWSESIFYVNTGHKGSGSERRSMTDRLFMTAPTASMVKFFISPICSRKTSTPKKCPQLFLGEKYFFDRFGGGYRGGGQRRSKNLPRRACVRT